MLKIEQNKYVHKDVLNNMARQQKYGIIDGLGVTADSPASMDVIVASGNYLFNGNKVTSSGDTITLDASHSTYNRYSLIVLDDSGNLSELKGTNSLNDDDPSLTGVLPINDYDPDTYTPIARIFVGAGVSTITSSDIKDLRTEIDLSDVSTLESGENITAGDVVYIKKSDAKVYVSDTGTADDIRANGIALNTATSGNDVLIIQKGKYITSGLTANKTYYLGASGAISLTYGAVQIGYSKSTTELILDIGQDDKDPVGTVKSYQKSATGATPHISAFWVEANGQTLSDSESPMDGQTLDNLNGNGGTQRFLRGSTTSGSSGGSATHTHGFSFGLDAADGAGSGRFVESIQGQGGWNAPTGTYNVNTNSTSTLPSYIETVYIIKIK